MWYAEKTVCWKFSHSALNYPCFSIIVRPPPHLYTSIMQPLDWVASVMCFFPVSGFAAPWRAWRHNRVPGAYMAAYIACRAATPTQQQQPTTLSQLNCLHLHTQATMSLASRCFAHFLYRAPTASARAKNTILLARHRLLTSSITSGNGPPATKVAPAVTVTDTKAGGGKTDQPGSVNLDLCGDLEGVVRSI